MVWRAGDDAPFVVAKTGTIVRVGDDGPTTVLDVTEPGHRRRANRACSAWRSTPPAASRTSTTPTSTATPSSRSTPSTRPACSPPRPAGCWRSTSRTPTTTVATSSFGPDGLLYIGMGDGGAGGDPERRATNPADLLGKLLRIDPAPRATSRTRSRRTTRSSASPAPVPRSGRPGCATRGASRSTGRPATCGSPTSARTRSRRSTSRRRPMVVDAGKGLYFGWSAFEGDGALQRRRSPDGATPPFSTYEPRAGLLGERRRAGSRRAGPRARRLVRVRRLLRRRGLGARGPRRGDGDGARPPGHARRAAGGSPPSSTAPTARSTPCRSRARSSASTRP